MRVDLRKALVVMAAVLLVASLVPSIASAGAPPSSGIVLSDVDGDGFVDIGILADDRSGSSTFTYFMQGITILGAGAVPGSPVGGSPDPWQNSGYPPNNTNNGVMPAVPSAGVAINDGDTEFAYNFDVVNFNATNLTSATLFSYASGQSHAGYAGNALIIDIGNSFLFKAGLNGLALDTGNSGTLPGPPAGYSTGGYPDINGDGTPDVSVISKTIIPGFQFVWNIGTCDGTACTIIGAAAFAGPPVDYNLVGFPDLNGDDTSDTLIQRISDGLIFGFINPSSTAMASSGIIGTPSGGAPVAGVGDLTGEGRDDIVLDIGSGFLFLWAMDGLTISPSPVSGVLPGPPAGTYTFPGIDSLLAGAVQ